MPAAVLSVPWFGVSQCELMPCSDFLLEDLPCSPAFSLKTFARRILYRLSLHQDRVWHQMHSTTSGLRVGTHRDAFRTMASPGSRGHGMAPPGDPLVHVTDRGIPKALCAGVRESASARPTWTTSKPRPYPRGSVGPASCRPFASTRKGRKTSKPNTNARDPPAVFQAH